MYQVHSLLFHYWLKSLFILQIFSTIDCWFPPPDCCGGLWLWLDFLLYATWSLVLWCCWLGGRKGIRPVKTEWWGAGVVVCLELGADGPADATATHWRFSKIQISFIFLVPAYPGSPGKRAVKCVCVCYLLWWTLARQGEPGKKTLYLQTFSALDEKRLSELPCAVLGATFISKTLACVCVIAGVSEMEQRSTEERMWLVPQRSQGDQHFAVTTAWSHRAAAGIVSWSSVTGAASRTAGITQWQAEGVLEGWRPAEDRCHTWCHRTGVCCCRITVITCRYNIYLTVHF